MDVLPCQLCPAEIEVSEEDPDASLSDLYEHLGRHHLSGGERLEQFLAAQLAAFTRPAGSALLSKRPTEEI